MIGKKGRPKIDKEFTLEESKKLIVEHNLLFFDDVVALLAISNSAFYAMFPSGCDEHKELSILIDNNKIKKKLKIREDFENSTDIKAKIALYKLIGTSEERKRLCSTYLELSGDKDKPINVKFKFGK